MKNLKAKLRNQGGFTLVEMLIVVAIIAILIAISIPMVNSSLERSQHSTDAANERAAKAAAILQILNNEVIKTAGKYPYDAVKGEFVAAGTTVNEYGKHTGHDYLVYEFKAGDTAYVDDQLNWNTEGSGTVKKCSAAKDVKHDS